jgi:dihydrofolate synthase/folylpolyglutamate synthase
VIADDPLAFLFGLERLGMKFGLDNIAALTAALGHPERSFPSLIVAGTNGKGSVTAMAERALRETGLRTARYTSPHLVRLEERFAIDGVEVTTATLSAAAARVRDVTADLLDRGVLEAPPTFFEATTAAAFDLFRDAAVEIAVLEVGLGGRLDATNVVTPLAAAITSIDFDHQAQLGSTIEAIAREKAGVIKPGIPVVCGPLPADADRVVREVCAERGATMIRARDEVRILADSVADGPIEFRSARRILPHVRLALRGRHQIDNAAVTVALLDALEGRLVPISDRAIRAGLSDTTWPGRLERLSTGAAEIILDAAHNPAGARALASYLGEIGWSKVALVFGTMRDKDVAAMLDELIPSAAIIVCTTPASPRAMPAAEVADLAARRGARVEVAPDPSDALGRACRLENRVVVAGSIFLVGPLRDIVR